MLLKMLLKAIKNYYDTIAAQAERCRSAQLSSQAAHRAGNRPRMEPAYSSPDVTGSILRRSKVRT
jgi:hypothetical protein